MNKILIMSDIHGNLSALNQVLCVEDINDIDGIILLGDLIDYGPRSNEVVEVIKNIPKNKILVNIWGNHEKAIIDSDNSRFSSERGRKSAHYTQKNMRPETIEYINKNMESAGVKEFYLQDKKCLAVHGSLADIYWKSITHTESNIEYSDYDIVFSGHSHQPHFYEHFYEADNVEYRNKKKTMFINPGAVGQPRNHNRNAQYVILETDTWSIQMRSVEYAVEEECALFSQEVDSFYMERLKKGI